MVVFDEVQHEVAIGCYKFLVIPQWLNPEHWPGLSQDLEYHFDQDLGKDQDQDLDQEGDQELDPVITHGRCKVLIKVILQVLDQVLVNSLVWVIVRVLD